MSQPPSQDPHSQTPPPVYPLDYATPVADKRTGIPIALNAVLIALLILVGLALLALGLWRR